MAISSPINVANISQGFKSLRSGLGRVKKSAESIRSILFKKTTVKQQAITGKKSLQTKRKENALRKEQEDILEASGIKPTIRRTRSAIVDSAKGFLGRILDFIGTLFVGWLIYNLPTLIAMTKDLIIRIKTLFGALSGFIGDIFNIFGDVGRILTGVLSDIKHLDLFDTHKRVQNAFNDLNTHFDDMGKQFEDGVKSVTTPLGKGKGEEKIPPTGTPAGGGPAFGQPGSSTSGGAPSSVGGVHKQALDIISKYESAGAGGYEAMNQGTVSDSKGNKPRSGTSKSIIGKNLTDMTIGEVISHQSHGVTNDQGFIHAAGRYQMIGNTLPGAMAGAGLKPTDKFSPENQDKMGLYLLRTGGINKWEGPKNNATAQERAIINQARRTPVTYSTQSQGSTPQDSAPGGGNLINVGKSILNEGFTIGENHYFTNNKWTKFLPNPGGFTPKGNSPVSGHANNADHAEHSLDITDWRGSESSGYPRLTELFKRLYSVKNQYNITQLIFDPYGYWFAGQSGITHAAYGGHANHLHVRFGGAASAAIRGGNTGAIAAINSQGSGTDVGAITPERRGTTVAVVDNRQPQQPPSGGGRGGGGGGAAASLISFSDALNSLIKKQILLELAYT
jgi:muramidase (phage lysozyme)